jgi:hypothetical protein
MDVRVNEAGQNVIARSGNCAISAHVTSVANGRNASVTNEHVALDYIERLVHRQDCGVSNQKGRHLPHLAHRTAPHSVHLVT